MGRGFTAAGMVQAGPVIVSAEVARATAKIIERLRKEPAATLGRAWVGVAYLLGRFGAEVTERTRKEVVTTFTKAMLLALGELSSDGQVMKDMATGLASLAVSIIAGLRLTPEEEAKALDDLDASMDAALSEARAKMRAAFERSLQ